MLEIPIGVLAVTWLILGFMCAAALRPRLKSWTTSQYFRALGFTLLGFSSLLIVWRHARTRNRGLRS
ncbi:hypothetical protein HYW60_03620 [Candidatus Kaiserbacteria bacterium]|nr:hypothetical protein [Candidatus Kaiserbacteria bacterium]